jgi:hypothetical protein
LKNKIVTYIGVDPNAGSDAFVFDGVPKEKPDIIGCFIN